MRPAGLGGDDDRDPLQDQPHDRQRQRGDDFHRPVAALFEPSHPAESFDQPADARGDRQPNQDRDEDDGDLAERAQHQQVLEDPAVQVGVVTLQGLDIDQLFHLTPFSAAAASRRFKSISDGAG